MWTPLIGPIAAILLSVAVAPAFLYAYLLWVMGTRLLQSLCLLTVRPAISGLYPPLLYYSQLYGALLKTWVLFRLDRQRWTRQSIAWVPALTPARAAPAGGGLAGPPPPGTRRAGHRGGLRHRRTGAAVTGDARRLP